MNNPLQGQVGQSPMMQQFSSFKQNPMQFLMQRNINIPQQYANNPQAAVQYLLNSGRMNQSQLNQLTQMAQQFGVKL